MFKPVKDLSPPLLVDIREAARLLNVSERTIWQLTNDRKLTAIRIGKRGIRYSYRALLAFAENTSSAQQE